jgi:predicted ATPase
LLAELRRRGFATIDEPGRRIVEEELKRGGQRCPGWMLSLFFSARQTCHSPIGPALTLPRAGSFFDIGLSDAASALEHLTGQPVIKCLDRVFRYNKRVCLAPPWPEIYVLDHERRHDFVEAVAEYDRLIAISPVLGYDVMLPK